MASSVFETVNARLDDHYADVLGRLGTGFFTDLRVIEKDGVSRIRAAVELERHVRMLRKRT